jgi:DNA-binding SARP family transcriptional activator
VQQLKPSTAAGSPTVRQHLARIGELARALSESIDALLADERHGEQPRAASSRAPVAGQPGFEHHRSPTPRTLHVYLLRPFEVFQDDRRVAHWPQCKAKAVFKYLATHHERPVPKEVLMDVFWPGVDAGAARNSLNVAMHGLRRVLAGPEALDPIIVFADGCYALNPAVGVWIDVAVFRAHHQAGLASEQRGDVEQAVIDYRAACDLHQQALLAEDRYESWVSPVRRSLQEACVEALERLSYIAFQQQRYGCCVAACRRVVGIEPCHEPAHRLLMRAHARLGQQHLALQQFHACTAHLARALAIEPAAETIELSARIRARLPV